MAKDYPNGLWLKCDSCGEILYKKTIEKNFFICSKCNYHFRINHKKYIEYLLDNGKLEEYDSDLETIDPLNFPQYKEKLTETQKTLGIKDAYVYGLGNIDNIKVVFGAMDFGFIGGSMGTVVGEKVARSFRLATQLNVPIIIVCTSGGARMQEGIFSLMQVAKTSLEVGLADRKGIPYISILTNPCYAGVMASFASLGDIIIAEPGAMLGFTGPRVIEETIKQRLPEGFQKAEFLLTHGFVDLVVPRWDLRRTLIRILNIIWKK
ncbi:MAG: acetyl-CoA carboxylase, carboxyltransferase subunit beta [candidate division WOR-3 bacterium]